MARSYSEDDWELGKFIVSLPRGITILHALNKMGLSVGVQGVKKAYSQHKNTIYYQTFCTSPHSGKHEYCYIFFGNPA